MTTMNIKETIDSFEDGFSKISLARKNQLDELSDLLYTHDKIQFICTHNSRRSIFAQIWSWVASIHYKVPISTFSGGTEVTKVYDSVIQALQKQGLVITNKDESKNPQNTVFYSDDFAPINIYSKKFDTDENPTQDFLAIMTCSDANANCPMIPGAKDRFSLIYEDPKFSDGTDGESETYLRKSKEIGIEMFYLFSKLQQK